MTTTQRRWRGLALLAGAVVAAHLLGLERFAGWAASTPAPVSAPEPAVASLQVRRIDPSSTPQAVPETTPAVPSATPAPKPRPLPVVPGPASEAARPSLLRTVSATQTEIAKPPAPAASAPAPAAATVPALPVPPPARWRYELRARSHGIELPGQAELEWRHDGQRYEARLTLRAPPLPTRTQRSTGRITPQGLAPERFSDRRRGEQAAHFDHEGRRITFSNNRPAADLTAGAQDRLSVLVQLGALLAAAGRDRPETVSLQVAGTGDADRWDFRIEGEEALSLPGGQVRALRLKRQPRHEHDQTLELWLAPGWDYAPVRLRLTDSDGEWLEQQWSGTDRP